jgi:tetratricopeptide (TPR) repeat protein
MENSLPHPTVFISYSHKDSDWVRNWLMPKLENAGIPVHIDFRDFEIGVAAVLNMERAVEKSVKTILVLTTNWVESEFTQFEGIMLQTQDPIGLKKRILPLKLNGCELPARLQILTYADFRDKDDWDFQFERLTGQIQQDFAKLAAPVVKFPLLAEENIDITHLPKTPYELFGRQKEIKILNDAWQSAETNVLSFVAYGGVGKSTLVNKWLEKMRWDNYRGAEKVYGVSFYSQGTKERVTSADKFISDALIWFGDPDPTQGSPWDKGQRLADLVRKQRTLLILDGMEPLQSGHDFEKGKIKDPALSVLVTQLARNNNGLCVITTRESVAELTRFADGVLQPDLEQISKQAGRALLRVAGVQGSDAELEAASTEFGNHALAINLLGSYLHDIEGHHIQDATAIPDLDIPEDQGKHPRRVIEAFEERFGDGPQVQFLRILGLFDRPAELEAIKAVHSDDPIAGLTDELVHLTADQWHELFERLRYYKLLARKTTHAPDIVDCHPIIREHFGQKLQHQNPPAWQQAHSRLYEYYKNLPKKKYPDTLEEMQPFFAAVAHACQAGLHQEALDDVYWERIRRKSEAYSVRQLGAFGSNLSGLAGFFDELWTKPTSGLTEKDKAWILNAAGFALRAVGRLREAGQPMIGALDSRIEQNNWLESSKDAGNLSELYVTLGEIRQAVDFAQRSVEYADRSGDAFQRYGVRTTLADAVHQAGNVTKAAELCREAEEMQKEDHEYRYLYSLQGFRFCDLLLSQGRYREVQKRASQTIQIARRSNWLLDIGLDNLSLGRAYLLRIQEEGSGEFGRAADYLDQAVEGLRRAGQQQELPRGLLARAGLYRLRGDFEEARGDLAQAAEIAGRGEMRLFMADYHLESARLCLAQGDKDKQAREHYEEAAKRVEEMGYHRRDAEVLLIEAALQFKEGDEKSASQTLGKAEKCIDDMGCHRWDIEVERIRNL